MHQEGERLPLLAMFAHRLTPRSPVRSPLSTDYRTGHLRAAAAQAVLFRWPCAVIDPAGNTPLAALYQHSTGPQEDVGLPSRRGRFFCGLLLYTDHVIC